MDGFEKFEFENDGIKHTVFHAGEGPPVLLVHELPGFLEQTVTLAERLRDAGFHVFAPLFLGKPGQKFSPAKTLGYTLMLCIRREFRMFANNANGPFLDWLRALSLEAANRSGHPKVGVIGMCLTGNYAISLIAEPHVHGAVGCQPSMPILKKAPLGIDNLEAVRNRADTLTEQTGGPSVLAYRFEGDALCPHIKLKGIADAMPKSVRAVELPGKGHSTLTIDLVGNAADVPDPEDWAAKVPIQSGFFEAKDVWGEDGEPTHHTLIEVMAFLKARLAV